MLSISRRYEIYRVHGELTAKTMVFGFATELRCGTGTHNLRGVIIHPDRYGSQITQDFFVILPERDAVLWKISDSI